MITLVTVGDLSKALEKLGGLPMKIRCSAGMWTATIEWGYPDYTSDSAVGQSPSMMHAIAECLAKYEKAVGVMS